MVRGRVMMTMFRSTGSCHLSLCKLPILPHVVTMKVTLNVTLPLLENRPSGKFIIDSQKGYTLAGALSTSVCSLSVCVVSIWGLAHDWPVHHSALLTPQAALLVCSGHQWSRPQSAPLGPLHPSRAGPGLRSPKPCYSFPRAGLPVIACKCCHLPLTFDD